MNKAEKHTLRERNILFESKRYFDWSVHLKERFTGLEECATGCSKLILKKALPKKWCSNKRGAENRKIEVLV
jgi:hypothetical protein